METTLAAPVRLKWYQLHSVLHLCEGSPPSPELTRSLGSVHSARAQRVHTPEPSHAQDQHILSFWDSLVDWR